MNIYKWLESKYLRNKTLYFKLNYIFFFFFMIPVMGFLYFGIKYRMLTDNYILIFFVGFFGFSFFGLTMLRKVFDEITGFSRSISQKVDATFPDTGAATMEDELESLIRSVKVLDGQLARAQQCLSRKEIEIKILKDLSELCYVTSDTEEILHVTLERALELTDSDIGSIMILKRPERKTFIVRASIGLAGVIKNGDRIDFETSIGKYAVLNKSAVVVSDIEKDSRFGRTNRPQYGSKSFICIPIKTSREIIGVLTVSRRHSDRPFTNSDADMLSPLMSNAAFTFENLTLMRKNRTSARYIKTMANLLKSITGSFRDTELLYAFLNEIKAVISFNGAILLQSDEGRPGYLTISDFIVDEAVLFSKGSQLVVHKGGQLDKALKHENGLLLEDVPNLDNDVDELLFGWGGPKAFLLTPLKIDGAIKGLLVLTAPSVGHFESKQRVIQWMACGLSLVIERNRLLASVVKRNQELGTLRQIGSALASSTFDINQVLNYTMDMIRVIMDVEAGSLYLMKDNELEFAVSFNVESPQEHKLRLRLGEGIPGYVAARGESLIINEGKQSSLFYPGMSTGTGKPPRSALCVPMISQGRVIGVIEVLNKKRGDFVANDCDLLQSISASVSIAIENANLYKETVSMAENERGIRRMFQKFVPKEVLDTILHGSESGVEKVEELKTLSLINIDLRGFSAMARRLGPQKTVSVLNLFFSVMGGIVFKHHGIVDKYLGDGFLAIFGAPVSSTSDADNAIMAALEMKDSLDQINQQLSDQVGVTLKIGISIHTGEVVVGNIGFEMKMDYTVIGDSVNDVFRLQDRTKPYPNSILVSEKTCRAATISLNLLEMEDYLGELRIYELLGIKSHKYVQPQTEEPTHFLPLTV